MPSIGDALTDQLIGCAGEEKWKAGGLALTLIAMSLATTLMLVRISYLQRNLETAMAGKDRGK